MSAPARILVVEDEPQLRGLLRLYLERDGHRVTDAGDGPSALAAYDAEPCDLVILDLMLPGMQGETVLEALREAGDVPVLITSAKRSDAERIAGLRAGADDYLAKPFNPHELTARVAAILRRTRAAGSDEPPPILSLGGGRLLLDPGSRRYTLADGRGGRSDARRVVAARRARGATRSGAERASSCSTSWLGGRTRCTSGSSTSTSQTCGESSTTIPARPG